MDSERIRKCPASLVGYFGAKDGQGVAQRIINEIPRHTTYIEGFAGSAAVYRRIRPAAQSFLIDSDRSVIDAWRDDGSRDLSTGLVHGDFFGLVTSQVNAMRTAAWPSSLLDALAVRETVLYLDPPYLLETRGDRRYKQELGHELEHRALLRWSTSARCMILISGYRSSLYDEMLQAWRCIEYPVMTRGGLRMERLWMNFPPATSLHDARGAGGNFRERERIKRRARSWASQLKAMSAGERDAVMESCIAAWRDAASSED